AAGGLEGEQREGEGAPAAAAGGNHQRPDLSKRRRAGLLAADGQDLTGMDRGAFETVPDAHLPHADVVQPGDPHQGLTALDAMPDDSLPAALAIAVRAAVARRLLGLAHQDPVAGM